jgi:flagellar basal-body rod protein FlgG
MRSLRIAASGMAAQQLNVETISNNIANMNTIGFKEQRAQFEDLLYQNVVQMGAQSSDTGTVVPTGVQLGSGVATGSIYRITTQGALTQTGNSFDVAISGRGYFQVQMPTGDIAYTRAGNFSVNQNGQLVTPDGYSVLPTVNIPINATSVTISASGQVQASIPGNATPQVVGQLTLANFFNEAGLEAIGKNLFLQSGASGQPNIANPASAGFGSLQQGYTESSNVDSVSEITNLIVAQRAYEMNSKVVNTADQMLQSVEQLKS